MLEAWTWKRIRWSLRKAQLPIHSHDLVLDVGSGSNPHPAADVLIERYIDSTHRFGATFVADRPTVLGNAYRMPFKDRAFDYVIAFHVLEHMGNPALFLSELQRVGKAGYIEAPNALFERLVPYDVHLLEIMNLDGTLVINKKPSARPDPFLNELNLIARSPAWHRLFYRNPKLFHVCYFWEDEIKFRIINPQVSCDWFVEPGSQKVDERFITKRPPLYDLRSLGLSVLRRWYRLRKRRPVNLMELLVCPECHGPLASDSDWLHCPACAIRYPKRPFPDFNRPVPFRSSCR